ncbi:Calx-beta domain-containing protein [Candidatus Halobeggiatoa sp. HSG11]|nr:Calx-beta domain-containing protein [Candidatus Halobeggiatoa sp. HSG11]
MNYKSICCFLFLMLLGTVGYAASFTVDDTSDTVGTCNADPDVNTCSLRQAITAANSTSGNDTITLSNTTYELSGSSGNDDNSGGDLDIFSSNNDDLTIEGNGATIDGKGIDRVFHIVSGTGTVTMNNLTITGGDTSSESTAAGGGIFNNSNNNTLVINNSTISDNTSGENGGGIQNYNKSGSKNPSTKLNNCTIYNNTASGDSGGIRQVNGTISIKNSIIAGNKLGNGSINNCGSKSTTTQGNNITDNDDCDFDDTGGNGDKVSTEPLITYDAGNGYYTLDVGSPAIDAGNFTTCETEDQRDYTRDDGDGKCDIGAYEHQNLLPEIKVKDGSTDLADGNDLDFGFVGIGTTVTKTITINNTGPGSLTLSSLSALGPKFSIHTGFGNTTVASSSSTTFIITIDTSTITAALTETVTFNSNDADENSFTFNLKGEVTNLLPLSVGKAGTGNGTVTGAGGYANGATVTLGATPDSNSTFSGWSTGCANSFTMNNTITTCTANFTKKDITPPPPVDPPTPPLPQTMKLFIEQAGTGTGDFDLSPNPKETICTGEPRECHYVYNTATKVTVTATADNNSNFSYWSGSSTCRKGSKTNKGGEVDIYIVSSVTCKLNFKLKPQTLSLDYEGEGNGTVKIYPSRGQTTSCSHDKCITFDGTKDITLTPEPDPYSKFDQWTGNEDCSDDGEIAALEMTDDKYCIAHFSLLPTYELTIAQTGSGTGTIVKEPAGKNCVDNTCEYGEGSEVILTAQPNSISSTFAGWNEDCGDGNITIMAAKTCTATFMQKPTYKLSLQTNGDGKVTANIPPPIDDKYYEGQTVTLVPELGINIKGVTFVGDCDSDKIVMDANKSCLVKFTEEETPPIDPAKPHTLHLIIEGASGVLAVSSVNGQTTCNGYCANNYADNTLVSIGIQPTTNARFIGWSKECIGGQIIMNSTKACTATFVPIHTLTVAKKGTGEGSITSDSGINCGEHCQTVHEIDDLITLTATPTPNSTFEGWNDSCLNGQVTINSSKTCAATFTAKPSYKLTVATEGIGKGQIESNPAGIDCGTICEAKFLKEDDPTRITLTPDASPGSVFKNWSCESESEPVDMDETGIKEVIMDGNKHCTAKFDSYGTIHFATDSSLEVNEEANTITLAVNRSGGNLGEVGVDYKTTDGGANSEDYVAQQGTLTWQDGQNDAQLINIPILTDKLVEGDETFVVTLLNPNGHAALGTPYQLEITIKNVPWESYVQFAMLDYDVNESEGVVRLIATRAGSSKRAVEVAIRTENGTATDDDYQITTENILAWESGDMEPKFIDINISQDELEGGEEYFLVAIDKVADTEGLELDPDKIVAVVNIFDTPPTGSLEFDRTNYNVRETDQAIEVLVNRVGGIDGEISVQYDTQIGSYSDAATPNQDFTKISGTLSWIDGDETSKTVTVPILLDSVKENAELFTLTLSEPTGGAALGVKNGTLIEIADMTGGSPSSGDDEINYPGVLRFSQLEYNMLEGDGEAVITVERVDGQFGEVTVQYATQDNITDTAGIVYEPTIGELTWAAGDSEPKQLTIKLLDNNFIGTDHVLQVKLLNPTGGTIIEHDEVVVNIQDDDKAVFVLSADGYAATEGQDAVVKIYRQGNNYSKVALNYEIKDGTAIAGEDYTKTIKTLVWESGDITAKEVKIPLRFDRLQEDNETFIFGLTNVSNKATIGTPSEATITIVETDPANCKPTPPTNGSKFKKQSVNCYLQNKPEILIKDVVVEPYGTIDGGILQGKIQNSGLIQNVTLTSDTVVESGTIAGNIVGQIGANNCMLPLLKGVNIEDGTTLSNVIISSDSSFDPINVKLSTGILFEDNSLIPNDIRLEAILGYMPIEPVFGRQVAILTNDVLCHINQNGILGVINELYDVRNKIGRMKQHDKYGYLYAYFGEERYAFSPTRVKHILRTQVIDSIPQDVIIDNDGKVTFITHLGREVIAHPVVQAPDIFNEALLALDLEPAIMLDNGNIQVNTHNSYFYQARADLTATITTEPLGLYTDKFPVRLVLTDSDQHRQQFIYPAANDTETLYALPDTKLTYEGMLTVQINNRSYTGLLDYMVTKGTHNELSIQDIDDINGDGCPDYLLNYPNGNSQIIFCTP